MKRSRKRTVCVCQQSGVAVEPVQRYLQRLENPSLLQELEEGTLALAWGKSAPAER